MELEGRRSTKKDHDRQIRRVKTAIALFCMVLIMACSSSAKAVETAIPDSKEILPRATATFTPYVKQMEYFDQPSGPAGIIKYQRRTDGVPHIQKDGPAYDYNLDCLDPDRPEDLRSKLCKQVDKVVADIKLDESAKKNLYPGIVLGTQEGVTNLCSGDPDRPVGGCYLEGGLIVLPLPPEEIVLRHEAGHALADELTTHKLGDICITTHEFDFLRLYVDFSRTDPPRPNQFPNQSQVLFIDELFSTMAEISADNMPYLPAYAEFNPADPFYSQAYLSFRKLTNIFKEGGGFEKLRQNQFEAAVATLGDANDPTGVTSFLELINNYYDITAKQTNSGIIPHKIASPGPLPPQCK